MTRERDELKGNVTPVPYRRVASLNASAVKLKKLEDRDQGIAFPIFWGFLPKQGNSNTQERLHLINQFLEVFGAQRIDCLLADREFIGEKWFAYLQQHQIRFRIWIKRDMKISQANGVFSPALNFFRSLPLATYCSLIGSRLVCGHRLYGTGMRFPAGEYVMIVSDDESDQILEDYKKRWKIEVLFQALKSSGFNFEETHLKNEERLKTLFSVLTIAFCWSYHVGAWRHVVKPIRIKKHQRPAKSIFRYGFDWIRQAGLNPEDQCDLFTQVLNLLWNVLTGPKSHIYQLYPPHSPYKKSKS